MCKCWVGVNVLHVQMLGMCKSVNVCENLVSRPRGGMSKKNSAPPWLRGKKSSHRSTENTKSHGKTFSVNLVPLEPLWQKKTLSLRVSACKASLLAGRSVAKKNLVSLKPW